MALKATLYVVEIDSSSPFEEPWQIKIRNGDTEELVFETILTAKIQKMTDGGAYIEFHIRDQPEDLALRGVLGKALEEKIQTDLGEQYEVEPVYN